MTFDEWWGQQVENMVPWLDEGPLEGVAKDAWDYQQKKIDELETLLQQASERNLELLMQQQGLINEIEWYKDRFSA